VNPLALGGCPFYLSGAEVRCGWEFAIEGEITGHNDDESLPATERLFKLRGMSVGEQRLLSVSRSETKVGKRGCKPRRATDRSNRSANTIGRSSSKAKKVPTFHAAKSPIPRIGLGWPLTITLYMRGPTISCTAVSRTVHSPPGVRAWTSGSERKKVSTSPDARRTPSRSSSSVVSITTPLEFTADSE
jgi:hypothetical protein